MYLSCSLKLISYPYIFKLCKRKVTFDTKITEGSGLIFKSHNPMIKPVSNPPVTEIPNVVMHADGLGVRRALTFWVLLLFLPVGSRVQVVHHSFKTIS